MTVMSRTPLTGRHVLMILVGFFAVVVLVNATFVVFAQRSWPGLSDPDAYRRGLAYNETLAQARAQAALGWQGRLVHRDGELVLMLDDREARALTGLQVAVELRRAGMPQADRTVALRERAPGLYAAAPDLGAGRWFAAVVAADGGAAAWRGEYELRVPGGGR